MIKKGHFFMLFAISHYEVCWVEISYIFEKKTSSLILIIKYIFDTIIVSDSVKSTEVKGHVAALLTVKANWLDTLTVKQSKVMINNDVVFFLWPMRKHLHWWLMDFLAKVNLTSFYHSCYWCSSLIDSS